MYAVFQPSVNPSPLFSLFLFSFVMKRCAKNQINTTASRSFSRVHAQNNKLCPTHVSQRLSNVKVILFAILQFKFAKKDRLNLFVFRYMLCVYVFFVCLSGIITIIVASVLSGSGNQWLEVNTYKIGKQRKPRTKA